MALNVLIVDDSAVMRAMIIKILRLSGLALGEIYEAANGEIALQVLNQHWIDLALIDINMPVMNGEEMLERIRQNPKMTDLPVIVISTEGSETRIDRIRQYGAGFIHKPFNPESIRELILSTLGGVDGHQAEDGTIQSSGPDF